MTKRTTKKRLAREQRDVLNAAIAWGNAELGTGFCGEWLRRLTDLQVAAVRLAQKSKKHRSPRERRGGGDGKQ